MTPHETRAGNARESRESGGSGTYPAHKLATGTNAAEIADAFVSTWQEIDASLSPIIGRGGMVALYKRSLHLTCPAHPWIAVTKEGVQAPFNFDALKAALAQQSSANAVAGGNAFLRTFYELLTSLIGASLAKKLLRSAWATCSIGIPAQETSP